MNSYAYVHPSHEDLMYILCRTMLCQTTTLCYRVNTTAL